MVNSGIDPGEVYPNASSVQFNKGYNVATGKMGNLISMGVIDPAKVTRCAFENAVSVVTTILSTNAVITMSRA
jgi:chaperonin GroEL